MAVIVAFFAGPVLGYMLYLGRIDWVEDAGLDDMVVVFAGQILSDRPSQSWLVTGELICRSRELAS